MKNKLLKLLEKYEIKDYDIDNLADRIIEMFADPKNRTDSQNSALWLFMTMLANNLNDSGLDMRKVLRPEFEIPWTKDGVHDNIWIPIQKSLYKTISTKDLKKQEQIDKIHEIIMKNLGEKFKVEYIPFPVDAKKQYEKNNHGTYRP